MRIEQINEIEIHDDVVVARCVDDSDATQRVELAYSAAVYFAQCVARWHMGVSQ